MIRSPLLHAGARRLALPLLMASLALLLRGHDLPGGGFAGGLVCASAFSLVAIAEGTASARKLMRASPSTWVGVGICLAVLAALLGPLVGKPVFASLWMPWAVPGIGKLGTPVLFDTGVFLTVAGMGTRMLFPLLEGRK